MTRGFRRGVRIEKAAPTMILLTPEEAGKQLRLSDQTVKRLARQGSIPGAKKIGSSGWRFPLDALERFAKNDEVFVSTKS
jgi:excisionase family DNA binding protein